MYASDETAKLSSTKLYLADLNNQPTGYKGETVSGIAAYEWTKGYQWAVIFQLTIVAPQSLFAPVDSLCHSPVGQDLHQVLLFAFWNQR